MADPITLQAPFIGSDGRPTIEPGAFYLDGNYALRVNSWNSVAGVVLTIRARLIRASDGEIVDSSWDHVPNTNRTKATNDFPLPEGFILNITVFAAAGTPLIGQTFVQVQLSRGMSGATLLLATMLQDYVTAVQALAYPGSPIRSSIEGGGVIRAIAGTAPGVGLNVSESVPTGARWEPLSFNTQLTTVAGGANRNVLCAYQTGAALLAFGISAGALTPASHGWFSFGPACVSAVDASLQFFTGAMPVGPVLLAGHTINTITDNIAGGDQFAAPQYLVREWLEAA